MWFRKAPLQIVHPYNLTCPGNENSYFHDFDIHVCDKEFKLKLFCSSFPSILLLIIIPIVYSKFYWRIKYNYFLFVAWLHERWKSEKELYKYDAFVSYNTHDEEWVYKMMLNMLETSALGLCLHHRDFQLGRDIIDNIVDSIHNCHKTICVVSRSYLQSEWCSLEMQLASYKLFDEMRDVLVLILLDDIPDRELSTYHRMRKLMLKKTYITWSAESEAQELFWTKVEEAVLGRRPSEVVVGAKIRKLNHCSAEEY
ncbi:toll-like receptor 13 [Xenopus laevis]|uniref:Toll-like receptor 13 n=1 Tax=Xenopus laevis TaxID=8355 RepID=A0A8J1LD44_XENLA|nr:toll-like receptor 13 [Xenopus laevis]